MTRLHNVALNDTHDFPQCHVKEHPNGDYSGSIIVTLIPETDDDAHDFVSCSFPLAHLDHFALQFWFVSRVYEWRFACSKENWEDGDPI